MKIHTYVTFMHINVFRMKKSLVRRGMSQNIPSDLFVPQTNIKHARARAFAFDNTDTTGKQNCHLPHPTTPNSSQHCRFAWHDTLSS